MTTNDVEKLRDEPGRAPLVQGAVPTTTQAGAPAVVPATSGALTSPVLPASAPTTTSPDADDGNLLDVPPDLELAVELAGELEMTLERHASATSPDVAASPDPAASADPADTAGPPAAHEPLLVWVDAGDVMARLGVDGWAEFDHLDQQVRSLHEMLGAHHEQTQAAIADRDAVDALARQDEETYQEALVAAMHDVAHERGVEIEVLPVRMAGPVDPRTAADVAELLAAAVRRAVLPQLGRAPHDLTDDAVAGAVRAAGRTYLERIRTAERPVPDVRHDHLEEELLSELQDDELMPEDAAVHRLAVVRPHLPAHEAS